ncbi:MAG: Riboflavin transporter [Gammaproteobacteria bacterium]|nr:Riboflavin transporter [Gammaproteobacteria bacterium]
MNDLDQRGLAAAVGASMLMAAMGVFIKIASHDINNNMVVFLRNAFGLAFLLPGLLQLGPELMRTRRLPAHLGRSLAGLAAMYCFFYAIAHMNLAEAVLLNFSSPVFTALLAALWLKERLSRMTRAAVLVGLVGISLILKPVPGHFTPVSLYGAASAILAAVAMVNIRSMAATEPTWRIVLYFSTIGTAVSAVPLAWDWETPSGRALLAMAGAGLCASVGQLLLTYSYASAPAAKVGTLSYSTVIFAGLFSWWLWQERPDSPSLLGAVLITGAGVLVVKRSPGEAD